MAGDSIIRTKTQKYRSHRYRRAHRNVIHPLRPAGALALTNQLLNATPTEFKDTFRIEKYTFNILLQ